MCDRRTPPVSRPRIATTATMTLVSALCAVAATSAVADAAPKKKYHFELTAVTAKSEVKPDVSRAATPRVEGQVKKLFGTHPQIVAKLDGAPDPRANPDGYRKYLAKKAVAGSFL